MELQFLVWFWEGASCEVFFSFIDCSFNCLLKSSSREVRSDAVVDNDFSIVLILLSIMSCFLSTSLKGDFNFRIACLTEELYISVY